MACYQIHILKWTCSIEYQPYIHLIVPMCTFSNNIKFYGYLSNFIHFLCFSIQYFLCVFLLFFVRVTLWKLFKPTNGWNWTQIQNSTIVLLFKRWKIIIVPLDGWTLNISIGNNNMENGVNRMNGENDKKNRDQTMSWCQNKWFGYYIV